MGIALYFDAADMPSVAAVQDAMRRAVAKFARFASVAVETAALEDTCWRSVEVDLCQHVVQHVLDAAVDAQPARLDALLAEKRNAHRAAKPNPEAKARFPLPVARTPRSRAPSCD